MKYLVIDEIKNGDCFTDEFETKQEAIDAAEYDFAHLSNYDKKKRSNFYVLESINPDEEAVDHYDGNPVKTWIENGRVIEG